MLTKSTLQKIFIGTVASLWLGSAWGNSLDTPRIIGIDSETLGQLSEAEKTTLQNLSRYKGQTVFYGPGQNFSYYDRVTYGGPSLPESRTSSANAPERSIVESDIIQEDVQRNLLFVLNQHRGLQIIDMKSPSESKIVGHLRPTGNNPKDMYYVKEDKKVVVLEKIYYDESGQYQWNSKQSRLILIDLENPSEPLVQKVVSLDGEVASSRLSIEGENKVLYVITSQRPNWNESQNEQEFKGFIHSVDLATLSRPLQAETPRVGIPRPPLAINSLELELPAQQEDINVVESEGQYFVIVATNKQRWVSWGTDNKNQVEVVDISDSAGKMRKLMVANIKGWVDERSQMFVKDKHLVVVSNFVENAERFQKIAVQSYKLPQSTQGPVLEPMLGVEPTSSLEPEIQGRGTERRGADIQDVRVDGEMLYVFWVPRNQIDPLEVFDLSKLAETSKVEHKVHFEDIPGFVQKAFPMTVKADEVPGLPAEKYILSLGFLESPRRPAMYLIALKESDFDAGQLAAHRVADLPLVDDQRTWENFNRQDKLFSLRRLSNTKGQILFTLRKRVENTFMNGAQLVNFDFSKLQARQGSEFFSNGGYLKGNSYSLKRAFYSQNAGDRVVTFNDKKLAVYPKTSDLAANVNVDAESEMELARDIRATIAFNANQTVQIVAQNAGGYWWSNQTEDSSIELRLTAPGAGPDAELHQLVEVVKLEGQYISQYLDEKNKKLYLLASTQVKTEVSEEDGGSEVKNYNVVYQVDAQGRVASDRFEVQNLGSRWSSIFARSTVAFPGRYYVSPSSFVLSEQGTLLVTNGTQIYKVKSGDSEIGVQSLQMAESCNPLFTPAEINETLENKKSAVQLFPVEYNGQKQIYVFYEEYGKTEKLELGYSKSYISKLSVEGDHIACGEALNIPGKPVAIENGYLLTEDYFTQSFKRDRVRRWRQPTDGPLPSRPSVPRRPNYDVVEVYTPVEKQGMAVVKLGAGGSYELSDMVVTSNALVNNATKIDNNKYLIFTSDNQAYYGGRYRDYTSDHDLVQISVNSEGKLQLSPTVITLPTNRNVGIAKAFDIDANKKLILVSSNNRVMAVSYEKETQAVSLLGIKYKEDSSYDQLVYLPNRSWAASGSIVKVGNTLQYSLGYGGVAELEVGSRIFADSLEERVIPIFR